MALKIFTSSVAGDVEMGFTEQNPWFAEGITLDDYILAKECGLLSNDVIENDFDKMIEEEEEFNEERQKFEDEKERFDAGFVAYGEYIISKEIYDNIDVRVIKKWPNWSLGSIDGNKCVYIPKSLCKDITIGELANMSLVYTGLSPNPWKAIRIEAKVDPVVVVEIASIEEFMGTNQKEVIKMKTLHIPKQDIGKMVGKNGQNIRKIMKDYFYNNHEDTYLFNDMEYDDSDKWWSESTDIPNFNITDKGNYTEVNIWYNSVLDQDTIKFNPIKHLFQKMYC